MDKVKHNDGFKIDAVHQITERRYPVREVSERLGETALEVAQEDSDKV